MEYKIPKLVHYTFKNDNLPDCIKENIKRNKEICSDCEFIFYDDNAVDEFIKTHFDKDVYNAYHKINPLLGAMRADFFRYCVLYIKGGIYIDIKSKMNVSPFSLITPDDVCLLDIPKNNLEPWRKNAPTHEQWLLIFAPGHPYLLSIITLMVKYIKNNYNPNVKGSIKNKVLHITGPDAFALAIRLYLNGNVVMHRTIDYDKYFELNCVDEYRVMYSINNLKHYSDYRNIPLYISN